MYALVEVVRIDGLDRVDAGFSQFREQESVISSLAFARDLAGSL